MNPSDIRCRTLILTIITICIYCTCFFFFFSSRRRHTRLQGDWSSDVCSSDLRAESHRLQGLPLKANGGRFRAAAPDHLVAVVDVFGEVALFEPGGRLLCLFLDRKSVV